MNRKIEHHSVRHTMKMNETTSVDWLKTRKARDTSSNTVESLLRLLSTGVKTFQETGKGISLSSFTTDKHRHIKTSMLKSGNSPFNSRQTQCEELNYRTGATQPF